MVVDAPVRSSIQRRNTSEGLHFTEERFRNAFSSAVVAMALQDHNGKFLETNGAWCRMMGYCREECVGKELRDRRVKGEFSVRDLTWDAAGALSMTALLSKTAR